MVCALSVQLDVKQRRLGNANWLMMMTTMMMKQVQHHDCWIVQSMSCVTRWALTVRAYWLILYGRMLVFHHG